LDVLADFEMMAPAKRGYFWKCSRLAFGSRATTLVLRIDELGEIVAENAAKHERRFIWSRIGVRRDLIAVADPGHRLPSCLVSHPSATGPRGHETR
jgi:hypothetical protein